ncbi:MAG: hypothetical protein OXC60_17320 [Litoreibacter sp.]|nr:hypothetical protein [Litoreibacter sp.]
MALVETEYVFGAGAGQSSIEMRKTPVGYVLTSSKEIDPLRDRLFRLSVAASVFLIGLGLLVRPELLTDAQGWEPLFQQALGFYAAIWGGYWSFRAMRGAPELQVDLNARDLHLLRVNWRGVGTQFDAIPFEEVAEFRVVDGLRSLDMREDSRFEDVGRIELVQRDGRVVQVLVGEKPELDLAVARLRRDIALY